MDAWMPGCLDACEMNYVALGVSCAGGSINLRAQGEGEGLKVGRPVAPDCHGFGTSCGPYRRIVDQILHHPAWAAVGMSHPGLGCWRHGSSWAAWADALLLGLGF